MRTRLDFVGTAAAREHVWPEDLRKICGDGELLQQIYEAQSGIEWSGTSPAMGSLIEFTPRPVLRTLVIYGLCVGVYGSRDIEAGVMEEKTFRYVAAGHRPSWNALHQFRRTNRERILSAVEQVLRSVDLEHSPFGARDWAAQEGLDAGCRVEAERRYVCSTWADSMAMDE